MGNIKAIILTLILLFLSGCGEDRIISPQVVFPDKLIVNEAPHPQQGAMLSWSTEMWNYGKLKQKDGVEILNNYRLFLLVRIENIGDRTAVNIRPELALKTWYGNSPKLTIVERNLDDILSPHETFWATFTIFFETKDNIWDTDIWLGVDDIGKAGIIPRVKFTWDTESI